jgi:hypothetical protein
MNTETSTIGGLPPGGPITGTELIEVEQNGVSVHVPASALKGEDGDDGASAYQVAVANGYSGTQSQWLASLVGASNGEGGLDKAGLIALITTDADVKAALLALATVSILDLDDTEIARAYPPLPAV